MGEGLLGTNDARDTPVDDINDYSDNAKKKAAAKKPSIAEKEKKPKTKEIKKQETTQFTLKNEDLDDIKH
jgi:hypothetical protein